MFYRIKGVCNNFYEKTPTRPPHITLKQLFDSMLVLFSALFALASVAIAFPSYGSLAGLSREELDQIIPTLNYQAPPNPPGPLKDDSTKLVNDAAHLGSPWNRMIFEVHVPV